MLKDWKNFYDLIILVQNDALYENSKTQFFSSLVKVEIMCPKSLQSLLVHNNAILYIALFNYVCYIVVSLESLIVLYECQYISTV